MKCFLLLTIVITAAYARPIKNAKNSCGKTNPPYACYHCRGQECYDPYNSTCDNALACFTTVEFVMDENNQESIYYHKGCFKSLLQVISFCMTGDFTSEPTFCCFGDLCNFDEFEVAAHNSTPSTYEELVEMKLRNWLEHQTQFEEGVRIGRNKKQLQEKKEFQENKELQEKQLQENKELQENKGLQEKRLQEKKGLQEKQLNITEIELPENNLTHNIPASLFPVIIFCVLFFSSLVAAIRKSKIQYLPRCNHKPAPNVAINLSSGSVNIDRSAGSSSLNQRYMGQDVTLIKRIGSGRYGEVWKGLWRSESVAVKIFSSKDEESWKNEVNIYTNLGLYHENVLGYKDSNIVTRSGVIEMRILSTFHEKGSLYDFLLENAITHDQMIKFVHSICSGLLHLHTEIVGSKGKPAIAHRDLKTRNILVTSNGTCVIADFGLAVVENKEASSSMNPINYRVGTKRYMAPEILDDSFKINCFESFKATDIYAFGLVLWEICSRCIIEGTAKSFHVAYHDCVPNDPDFEDMKKVVCIEKRRPEIPGSWSSDQTLISMAMLMNECWQETPEARCSLVRLKTTIDKLYADKLELQSTS